jgi:Zn-finger nucleic acid-binding protein
MKCPACARTLREKRAGEITLDMCYGGCGGIWFDAAELQRTSGVAAAALHSIWQGSGGAPQAAGPRACPRCAGQTLERKWFSDAREVEIDQCPRCGGVWLDDGEFTRVHEELKRGKQGPAPLAATLSDAVVFVRTRLRAEDGPPRLEP